MSLVFFIICSLPHFYQSMKEEGTPFFVLQKAQVTKKILSQLKLDRSYPVVLIVSLPFSEVWGYSIPSGFISDQSIR